MAAPSRPVSPGLHRRHEARRGERSSTGIQRRLGGSGADGPSPSAVAGDGSPVAAWVDGDGRIMALMSWDGEEEPALVRESSGGVLALFAADAALALAYGGEDGGIGLMLYDAPTESWNDIGIVLADVHPRTLSALSAVLEAATHLLNYGAGHGGAVSGETVQEVEHGGDATAVEAVAEAGYVFAGWSDGRTDAARRDTEVAGAITVKALFKTYLQSLIDGAQADEVIEVGAADLGEAYAAGMPVVIDKEGFVLRSAAGPEMTLVDAEGGDVAFIIEASDVSLEGFWIGNFAAVGVHILGNNARVVDMVIDGYDSAESVGIVVDSALGAQIGGCRIEDCAVGIRVDGASDRTLVSNSVLTRNEVALKNRRWGGTLPVDARIIHSSIDGNTWGVQWQIDEGEEAQVLRAVHNWWGDPLGPSGEGPGEGDGVSENVDWADQLGHEPAGVSRGILAGDGERGVDVRAGAAVSPSGGMVFATSLSMAPGGLPAPAESSSYWQLLVLEDDGITEIIYELGYIAPTEDVLYWYDKAGGRWLACSEEIVQWDPPDAPNPFADAGYDGYVRITVDTDEATRPYYPGDFSSVVFALLREEGEEDVDDKDDGIDEDDQDDETDADDRDDGEKADAGRKKSSSSEWYECFIATAAYGTPMATEINALRTFSDQVLLKSESGEKAVEAYYRLSPPVAGFMRQRGTAQAIVRQVLRPVVEFSKRIVVGEMETDKPLETQ